MDAEILEKALNEIMVCKNCKGSVSILENRNCLLNWYWDAITTDAH